MGAVMVAFQTLVATTHICIPSIAYGRLFGFPAEKSGKIGVRVEFRRNATLTPISIAAA